MKTFLEFINESVNGRLYTIQDIWEKYNPTLHSGDYPDLTTEERKIIKEILSLHNRGLDFNDISNKIKADYPVLKNIVDVFNNDLIRRSLPQGM
jgi:hypothetical protein